jgi:hypothetical protein
LPRSRGSLMRATLAFLAAIFGTLLLAALLAYPYGSWCTRWSRVGVSIESPADSGSCCC